VRSYDPTLKRFLQPDPNEVEGLFNYVYAADNQDDRADSSGLLVAKPLRSGNLLTDHNNVESNVAIGSPQRHSCWR